MTKNAARINDGLKMLGNMPYEIVSGTVVAGSLDTDNFSVSVQPSDDGKPIDGVILNTITENGNGMVLFPRDGSDVVIGCIDGPGEWTLLKASELLKATITIGDVKYEMDETRLTIQNGNVVFNVSGSLFKVNTGSESLYQLLKDCFTYLANLTVSTPAGASSIPINVADFNNLMTRLDNLLTS